MVRDEKPSSPVDGSSFHYGVGIDIGSQTYSFCVLKPDKSQVAKPIEFANDAAGFTLLREQLDASADQVLIGREACAGHIAGPFSKEIVFTLECRCCDPSFPGFSPESRSLQEGHGCPDHDGFSVCTHVQSAFFPVRPVFTCYTTGCQ
jgi:transposase